VKLERLLKIPRSARTIQLVINIPESSPRSTVSAPLPKPTGWARAWAILKVAGPATVAIAAIVISVLSLQRQDATNRDLQQANAAARQVEVAAAAANERRNAEQVSFLETMLRKPPSVSMVVENRATTPVYNVTFQVEVSAFTPLIGAPKTGGKGHLSKEFIFWLGNIPACSSGTVSNLVTAAIAAMKKTKLAAAVIGTNPVGVYVDWMSFADSSSVAWRYSGSGVLRKLESLPATTFVPDAYLAASYKNAIGCT
jgi:hypothetical protein